MGTLVDRARRTHRRRLYVTLGLVLALALAAFALGEILASAARPVRGSALDTVMSMAIPPDGRPLYLVLGAGLGQRLAPGEVAVTYRNGSDLAVERFAGVSMVERYMVNGELEQLVLYYTPYRTAVFNRPFVVRYVACQGMPESTVVGRFFYHYDPDLEAEKNDLREASLLAAYRDLLGRDPTEQETLWALHDMARGVSPPEEAARLAQGREATLSALAQAGLRAPNGPWSRLCAWPAIARALAGDGALARPPSP